VFFGFLSNLHFSRLEIEFPLVENSLIPNRLLRLAAQLGVPLVLLVLYWDVVDALWRLGWTCLLQRGDAGCQATGLELFQVFLTLVYALAVYSGVRLLAMVLVAQFTLPVETWEDRRRAVDQLLAYTRGRPGPALSVRDGRLVARLEEQQQRKGRPGVVLVDSSSEVVLQTDTEYFGTRGPGLVFTRRGQQVIPLDMRKQRRTAKGVKAITRDGLEVMADITVTFALDSGEPQLFRDWRDPDRPPFKHNEISARRAVYGKAVDARYKDVPWSELPPLVAADVWRDLLIVRDLESLFTDSAGEAPPLERLQQELGDRLKGPEDAFSSLGFSRAGLLPAGKFSREYLVLHARGIRVDSVAITQFSIAEKHENQRIGNWKGSWEPRAAERAARTDPVIAAMLEKGKGEGGAEILEKATEELRRDLGMNSRPAVKATLRYLLRATQDLNREAGLCGEGVSTAQRLLEELQAWAANLQEDGRQNPDYRRAD